MNDSIDAYIKNAVQGQLRDGYGDLTQPLRAGEYVSRRLTCPHVGCDWELDVEWSNEGGSLSRLRGHDSTEAECQAHLETHLPPI